MPIEVIMTAETPRYVVSAAVTMTFPPWRFMRGKPVRHDELFANCRNPIFTPLWAMFWADWLRYSPKKFAAMLVPADSMLNITSEEMRMTPTTVKMIACPVMRSEERRVG